MRLGGVAFVPFFSATTDVPMHISPGIHMSRPERHRANNEEACSYKEYESKTGESAIFPGSQLLRQSWMAEAIPTACLVMSHCFQIDRCHPDWLCPQLRWT